eukprot:gene4744-5196_t
MEIAILSDPTNLILLGISILCILIGATFLVGNANGDNTGKGGLLQRAKSLVDMSAFLLQEERSTGTGTGSGSGTTTTTTTSKTDNRVLHPIEFRPFRVLKTIKLNHNTKLIRFEIPHGRSLGLTIGKHISIQAHINGNRVMRAYTPSSPIDQVGYFDVVVKAYEYGKLSPYLHSLKIGQQVDVRGPIGRFKYLKNSHPKIGLIAGGTGLAPCLQVIRTVLDCPEYKDDTTNFVLFFQNRTEEDIFLEDELELLRKKHPNRLAIHYFLSNPSSERYGLTSSLPEGGYEHRGYISNEMLHKYMSRGDGTTLVGICGPSGFNDFAKRKLMDLCGHDEQSIFIW